MISDRYYYDKMAVSQQVLYKKIYDAIIRYDEYVICGENDYTEEEFNTILSAVIMDNPNVFYVRNTSFIENTPWGLLKLHLKYFFPKKDKEQLEQEIKKYLEQMLQDIDVTGKGEEELIKDIHDYLIIKNQAVENDNIEKCAVVETVFENKVTVRGVAYTYKYLLNSVGIKSNILCCGFSNASDKGSVRTWNSVNLYGEVRYIDIFEDALNSKNNKICYDYFGLTDEMILKNYNISLNENVSEKDIMDTPQTENMLKNNNEAGKSLMDIFNTAMLDDLGVADAIELLKNMPQIALTDDFRMLIEKFIQQLEVLYDLECQYPEEKSKLEKGIVVHMPDLIRILREYCRYKKYSAASKLSEVLYEKLSEVIDRLMKTMQYNTNAIWSQHANEMINDMSGIQKNLIDEKKNREKCPIDIDNLNEQSDLNDYILILEYLKSYGLPQEINEQIILILDSMKRLQQLVLKNSDKILLIENFKNYYLPEAIHLVFLYDEYEDKGVSREKLDELYENIRTSLDAVSNAINMKLDEIHTFEVMETKARAKALTDIIGQDGYSVKHEFNGLN